MSTIQPAIAITLHILSAVIWVGGMFFAHMALRPVVASLLEPPIRLPLMSQVLTRFFPWVWLSVVVLWATGFWMISGAGMGNFAMYIHIMLMIAAIMTVIFAYIFFIPFPRLKEAVANKNFPEAGKELAPIRKLIGINLVLGLITIVVAAAGRSL